MQERDIQPQPWWAIGLGALPCILVLTDRFIRTLSLAWPQRRWVLLGVTILIILVYIGLSLRKKEVLIWTFPGISIGVSSIIEIIFSLVYSALPTRANGIPTSYQIFNTTTSVLSISIFVAGVVLGAFLARRYGTASILLISGWIGLGAHSVLEPTYGFYFWFEDRLLLALLDIGTLLPFLILLPIWVLRARSETARRKGLYYLPALSLVLMVPFPIINSIVIWQREMMGDQPPLQIIPQTLAWGSMFAFVFWGMIFAIVYLYSWVRRSSPPIREHNATV
jgi:hypothetical protein